MPVVKKLTLVFVFITAFTASLFCQINQTKVDSLNNLLNTKLSDTALCSVYIQLAEIYQEYNADKNFEFSKKSDSLALLTGNKILITRARLRLGMGYYKLGQFSEATKYLFESLQLSQETGELNVQHRSYNNLGNVYIQLHQVEKSLDYFLKASEIASKMGDKLNVARYYVNIGTCYKNLNKYDLASEFYYKALKEFSETNNKRGIMQTYTNLATLFAAEHDLAQAQIYMLKAIKIAVEVKDDYNASLCYSNLGALMSMTGKLDSGIYFLDSALHYANLIKSVRRKEDIYRDLASIYSEKKEFKKAFEYSAMHQVLFDSLTEADNSEKFSKAEQKYQSLEKEKELLLIKKNAEISKLENSQKKFLIYVLILGVLAAVLAAFIMFSRYSQKKKDNAMLEQSNALITHQKKEITDSINYAKRIQESILPPASLVKQLLPNSFVLYKPKDIVSGDFYWVEKKDTKVVFAAVDCTGHGVPGAMMSVLGFNLLSQTVTEKGLTKPSEILQHLDFGVNQMLRQSSETNTVRDGMDLALCTIDFKTKEMQFAGAYNGLWIIRKDANEVEEIKPDKSPIGVNVDGVVDTYTNHERKLASGDTVYIFSDGYADQFGGRNGKKFKYKPMKELLLKIKNQSMEEQNNLLDKAITDWQGDLEQVDDILVIGVRI